MGKKKTHRSLSTLKGQLKYRKPICPFICSTFHDFQVERDILVKKVFPAIDAICRERGTYCAPVDLRWGINDYQTSSGQVINLCLDYVTKCAPFFICILGERYGSCRPENSPPLPKSHRDLPANASWIDRNLVIAAELGYVWVSSEPHSNSSVTALEIAQRNFLSAEVGDEFSFYYVRQQEHLDHLFLDLPEAEREQKLKMYQPESEYANRRVRELKAEIAKRGLPLKYFKTPEELQLLVLCDWKAVVDCLYPPLYDHVPQAYMNSVKEWISQEAFAESRRRVYISTPELASLFNDLTQFALSSLDEPKTVEDEKPESRAQSYSTLLRRKRYHHKSELVSMLLLVGERGCGKSSVIANWYRSFEESHPEVTVVTHFVGSSAHSTDLHSVMRRFTEEIRNEYPDVLDSGNDLSDPDADVSDFHNTCEEFHAALKLGPCVLVLDGADELAECYGCSYKKVKEMSWLPYPLPPQCKVIVTCARSDAAHKTLCERDDVRILSVPLLKDARSKMKVVREYLAIHCKCLDKSQLTHIVSSKLSDRPIFLSVLANELRMFGVYSRLDYHLESYLDALSMRDLWSKIILRWVRDYSWSSEQGNRSDSGDNENGEITGWVADALRLIACSRNGLTRDEILDMLNDLGYNGHTKVTLLDWALFRSAAMDSLLERPEGLISFFHQHFKEAVEHTLLGSPIPGQSHTCDRHVQKTVQELDYSVAVSQKKTLDRCHFHRHIAHYFLKQKADNRQLEELPWQLERAGEFDQLAKVLSEPRIFLELVGDGIMDHRRLEMIKYWKILEQQGYSIQDTYWDMLRRALGREENLGSVESLADGTISSVPSSCRLSLDVITASPLEPTIPQIVRTSPSLSSGKVSTEDMHNTEEQNSEEDMSVVGSSRSSSRTSFLSENSCSSIGSYASSEIDINEAFVDGRARGPKAMAKLTMATGQFLSVLCCFSDAEKMLLTAHDKLGQISFSGDCQRLLCSLEESLGNLYLFQLKKAEALHWYTRALSTVEELLIVLRNSEDEKSLIEMKGRLLTRLGSMNTHNKDLQTAETMLTQAKACFEEARSCTGRALVQHHIGYLRMQQGDFESAEILYSEALASFERWFGKNYPRIAEIINDLANLLCHPHNKSGENLVRAEHLYRRALHIRETCYGPDHLLVATSSFHLGMLLKRRQSDRLAQQEALRLLERALDIRMTKLGETHVLTKKVRRTLKELQASLRTRNKFTLDRRSTDLPYSSLTWHDEELVNFERSAQQKAEREKTRKTAETSQEECSTTSIVTSDDFTVYKTETSGNVNKQGTMAKQDSSNSRNGRLDDDSARVGLAAAGETNEPEPLSEYDHVDTYRDYVNDSGLSELASKPRSNQYLDSFVFQISDQPVPGYKRPTARPHSTMLPTKPSNYGAQSPSRGRGVHTLSETLEHYAALGDQRRIQSAPPCNRTATAPTVVSNAYHRMSCPAPDPNAINLSNSYSVVYGPNTSIESLLGGRESPRYGVVGASVHHGSAWYPPPGRYTAHRRLCPPRRLQRRANQNKHSVLDPGGRVSRTSFSSKDMIVYSASANNYRATTKGVHFDGNNLESVQGTGVIAH